MRIRGIGRKRERGQSLLETAISIIVMFAVVFWVFEVGWLMYTYTVMADAANEGVRYAIVHSGSGGSFSTNVQNRVKSFASTSLHDTSSISITVSDPDGDYNPPHRVRVQVSCPYVPWLAFVMKNPPSMNTYSEGPMVVQ
jgi:Flp pilus assembly protein TadG